MDHAWTPRWAFPDVQIPARPQGPFRFDKTNRQGFSSPQAFRFCRALVGKKGLVVSRSGLASACAPSKARFPVPSRRFAQNTGLQRGQGMELLNRSLRPLIHLFHLSLHTLQHWEPFRICESSVGHCLKNNIHLLLFGAYFNKNQTKGARGMQAAADSSTVTRGASKICSPHHPLQIDHI